VSPRANAAERLQRMLAVVPWVIAHPGVRLAEVAERFGIPERELERDLEVLPLCGLPPYTPDTLIEVDVVDDRVTIRMAEYLERPRRFTPAEGFAILAAGRALLAVPGSDPDGPLTRALAKLEHVLGPAEGVAVEVGPSGADHELVGRLQQAAADHEQVTIDYYSFGRDAASTRDVDPWAVYSAGGQWYVAAWCHQAGDERLFRVDRIRALRPTGERFDPAPGVDDDAVPLVYSPRPEDPRVVLRLAPDAAWVVESLPHEDVHALDDGWVRVVMAVSEPAWLERLLLGLGPDAVVEAPADLVDVAPRAARRLRARYGPPAPAHPR
jgi:proteasome accessory factor C